jgi:hypothetical protein
MDLGAKNIFWGTFQEYKTWVKNTFHKTLHKKMLQESFRYVREGKGNPNES